LKLKKSGGRWRVIDQATNGRWGIPLMQAQYQSKNGQLTPMQAMEEMVAAAEARRTPAQSPKTPPKQDDPPF
jgi:hypothetical protein